MSVIENLRRPAAKPAAVATLKAVDIAAQLATAENDLRALESQHGSAALDAVARSPGGADRLTALNGKLSEARERVSMLRAAHKAALERDEAALAAQRAALQKTQIAAMRKHLEMRDRAAAALSEAISEAAKQYHLLLDHSAKAQAACPIGMNWPQGDDWNGTRRYVVNEFFRVSASPGNQDGRSLPGSEEPDARFTWQPDAIPPMAEKIKAASRFVLEKITGNSAA